MRELLRCSQMAPTPLYASEQFVKLPLVMHAEMLYGCRTERTGLN